MYSKIDRRRVARGRCRGRPGGRNMPDWLIKWAMLVEKIDHADPLRCGRRGGTMKIIAFIEARQGDLIRKILEHCGLRHDPPPRAPPNLRRSPQTQPKADASTCDPDASLTYEVDPDFLEYQRREKAEQPDLPFQPGAAP